MWSWWLKEVAIDPNWESALRHIDAHAHELKGTAWVPVDSFIQVYTSIRSTSKAVMSSSVHHMAKPSADYILLVSELSGKLCWSEC